MLQPGIFQGWGVGTTLRYKFIQITINHQKVPWYEITGWNCVERWEQRERGICFVVMK